MLVLARNRPSRPYSPLRVFTRGVVYSGSDTAATGPTRRPQVGIRWPPATLQGQCKRWERTSRRQQIGIVELRRSGSEPVSKLHLRDVPCVRLNRCLKNSGSPATQGHSLRHAQPDVILTLIGGSGLGVPVCTVTVPSSWPPPGSSSDSLSAAPDSYSLRRKSGCTGSRQGLCDQQRRRPIGQRRRNVPQQDEQEGD